MPHTVPVEVKVADLPEVRGRIDGLIAENSRLRSELEAVQPIIDAAQAVVDWWSDPTETTAVDLFSALHAALAAAREAQP